MKAEKRKYKVTTCLTETEYKKLEKVCKKYDRTKSWVISHLILAANDDLFPEIFGGDSK
jgi:hypothetical protein